MWRNVLAVFGVFVIISTVSERAAADNWPAWRGPLGTGVTQETDLPVEWSDTENVRWKIPLDQPGNSTPIVWGDRIFLTQQDTAKSGDTEEVATEVDSKDSKEQNKEASKESAEGSAEQELAKEKPKPSERTVLCFDRADGSLLWQKGVTYTKKETTHATNPFCSSSPVTDGECVIAWFGSAGLVCYDMDGKQLWFRDLGEQSHVWGYGASPMLDDELCYLNFGPGPRSFVIAINKRTGETVWEDDVPEPADGEDTGSVGPENANKELLERAKHLRGSFSTPLMIDVEGHKELIVSMPNRMRAFDPTSGKILWTCDGLGRLVYTSTMWGDGVLIAFGGWHSASIAVRPGGEGQVDESHLVWRIPRSKSRLGSGVIKDKHLFICDSSGIIECLDLEDGKSVWKKRLRASGSPSGNTWSSLVLSGDKIYALNQSGDAFVFRAGPKFKAIATNKLGERTNSSIAPSDGELFIRTHKHLWCISEKK